MSNYTPCIGTGQPTTDKRVMRSDSPRFFHLNGKVTARCQHCDKPVRLRSMNRADDAAPMHKSALMVEGA